MVAALALQKRYLPLAELEPQLWYDPFPASAYQGMVAAQEEVDFHATIGLNIVVVVVVLLLTSRALLTTTQYFRVPCCSNQPVLGSLRALTCKWHISH